MRLLHIDSSALGANSASRQLTERIVAQWRIARPDLAVEYLDLAQDAPTHLSLESLGLRAGPDEQGLAGGKTVIVASTRGGVYSTNPALSGLDHQESYLKTVFGFFGIGDVQFVRAEGVAMGDAAKARALDAAVVRIKSLATDAANQPKAALAG